MRALYAIRELAERGGRIRWQLGRSLHGAGGTRHHVSTTFRPDETRGFIQPRCENRIGISRVWATPFDEHIGSGGLELEQLGVRWKRHWREHQHLALPEVREGRGTGRPAKRCTH